MIRASIQNASIRRPQAIDKQTVVHSPQRSLAKNEYIDKKRKSTISNDMTLMQRYGFKRQTQEVATEQNSNLSLMMSFMFGLILEVGLDKVSVIAGINRWPLLAVDIGYVALSERYNEFMYNEDYLYDEEWQFEYCKLKRDVSYLRKCLTQLIENLKMMQNFDDLFVILKHYHYREQNEKAFLASRNFNEQEIINLRHAILSEYKELGEDIHDVTGKVGILKDVFNDTEAECQAKKNYINSYEFARQEQNSMILNAVIDKHQNTIRFCETESNKMQRVHEEIVDYLIESKDDFQKQTEYWMEKYQDDLESYELKIANMKVNVEHAKDDLLKLQTEYERRVQEMADWIEYKRQKELAAKELKRQTQAAIIIQRWWREVMFRLKIGPFRKKKGKGGKKKGSAKGSSKASSGRKK